jgi:hypothetical protein
MSSPSSVKLCNGCGEVLSGLIYEVKKHRDEPTFAIIGVCCIKAGRHSIYPTCYLIPHDTLEELLQMEEPLPRKAGELQVEGPNTYSHVGRPELGTFRVVPAAPEPAASEPAASEPAAPEPAASEPAASEPVLTEAEEDKILPTVHMPSLKFCDKEEAARLTKIYKNRRLVNAAWNRVVKAGIRENINSILEECRDVFTEKGQFEELTCKEVRAIIKDWPTFCRKVYAHLKADGSFLSGDEHIFNDFEDTAGGCDEIVWDAACEIINKKGAAPLPVAVPAPAALPLAVVTRAAAARMIDSQATADQAATGQ